MMKHLIWALLAISVSIYSMNSLAADKHFPPDALVPDQATAYAIAEAILSPIYGAEKIRSERPYVGKLENGIWTIQGSIPKNAVGGAFFIRIARKDGRVIDFGHYR